MDWQRYIGKKSIIWWCHHFYKAINYWMRTIIKINFSYVLYVLKTISLNILWFLTAHYDDKKTKQKKNLYKFVVKTCILLRFYQIQKILVHVISEEFFFFEVLFGSFFPSHRHYIFLIIIIFITIYNYNRKKRKEKTITRSSDHLRSSIKNHKVHLHSHSIQCRFLNEFRP